MIKRRVKIKHFSIVGLMSPGWVWTQVRTHSDFCWTRGLGLGLWSNGLGLGLWSSGHGLTSDGLGLWPDGLGLGLWSFWTRTHCRTHESGLTPTLGPGFDSRLGRSEMWVWDVGRSATLPLASLTRTWQYIYIVGRYLFCLTFAHHRSCPWLQKVHKLPSCAFPRFVNIWWWKGRWKYKILVNTKNLPL